MAALLSQAIQVNPVKDLEDMLDPGSLLKEGEEMGAISQGVKKSFECLDDNINHLLKIRYLLLHAYEELNTKHPTIYKEWLRVLHKHGITSDLVTLGHRSLSGPDSEPNSACDTDSSRLSTKHILPLTEILADISYKWKEIRVSLNLPKHVRSDIHTAILLTCSNKICLCIVLKEWIMGKHPHAKSPTINNLKKSLGSQLVGLGDKASQLQDGLNKLESSFMDEILTPPPLSTSPQIDAQLQIISQSGAVEVAEEKGTLLEVQAVIACANVIAYKWEKDGFPLVDDNINYHGTSKQILCINNATLASQGTYICELKISADSDQTVALKCKPISVTVHLLPRTGVLVSTYSCQPEIPMDSWPPAGSNAHIRLAILKREVGGGEFISTVQGSIEGSLDKSDVVSFEEAFALYKSGTFILVKGRPGSGKTTLVHKISKDWAAGKSVLKGARLVFHVNLKRLIDVMLHSLIDLLNLFYHDTKMADTVLMRINESNGEGVCFIMDGLDEYNSKKSIIHSIIQRECLWRSMIIMASRPVATASLAKMADMCVEVVGFLTEQSLDYADNYTFKSTINGAERLKLYLAEHSNVLHTCYLPLHASMLSFIHDRMKGNLPSTETEIYKLFTTLTLLRTLKLKDKNVFISAVEDLDGDNQESFHRVCKLAFDITTCRQECYQKSLPLHDQLFLSFVSVDTIYGVYGPQDLYSFSHLAFQGYLAALHISQLDEGKQMDVIRTYGNDDNMQIVWRFYCGLLDVKTLQCKFEEILKFHNDNDLFCCQCACESQQVSICTCVVFSGEAGALTFKNLTLSTSDLTSIGYVIATIAPFLKKLTLCSCNMRGSIGILSRDLGACSNLQNLDLSHSGIGASGVQSLHLDWFADLLVLNLSYNEIGDDGAIALAEGLKYSNSLTSLNLEKNEIGDDGLKVLCEPLQEHANIELLNISSNNIGDVGAVAISDCLKNYSNLLSLSIDCNKMCGDGVASVAVSLKNCKKLLSFKSDHNKVSDCSARILSDSLKHCQQIQIISLSSSGLTDDGAIAFSKCLTGLTCLQTLNLDCNEIGDAGAQALVSSLNRSHSLYKLTIDLKGNQIGNKGANAVSESLELNFNLQKLGNNITDDELEKKCT